MTVKMTSIEESRRLAFCSAAAKPLTPIDANNQAKPIERLIDLAWLSASLVTPNGIYGCYWLSCCRAKGCIQYAVKGCSKRIKQQGWIVVKDCVDDETDRHLH